MNNKGQALVEFVLILPIIMVILFAVIDFGIIFNAKIDLENCSDDIVNYISNGKSVDDIKDNYNNITIDVSNYNDDYKKISISRDIDIMTPGLDSILGDPYIVKVERIVNND